MSGEKVSSPVPPGFTQTRAAWFNPAAFQVQPFGTIGNAPRNFLSGPAYQDIDFALMKNFKITEALKQQFRSEYFNLLNHPNFGNPNSNLSAGTLFGQILSAYALREIQFVLKLLW
jgi:hypothetical protein